MKKLVMLTREWNCLEKVSAIRIAIERPTLPCVASTIAALGAGLALQLEGVAVPKHQMPDNSTMATRAAMENQAMLCCPKGSTMNAAKSGPSAVEIAADLKHRLRHAVASTREGEPGDARGDSGWNTEEPMPMWAAASTAK